jgi:hypothetical protein
MTEGNRAFCKRGNLSLQPLGDQGLELREKNRVEKLLEDAQIKLPVVVSDIFGVSGRDMMAALISGERSPQFLAQMARSRMRTKIPQLVSCVISSLTSVGLFGTVGHDVVDWAGAA